MPSEIYDLKDNALYRRLKDKAKHQLAKVPADVLKCIVLGDAGCRLLSNPRQSAGWQGRPNGTAVIWEFLKHYSVDFVIILSPQQQTHGYNNPRYWSPEIYPKVQRDDAFYAKLRAATTSSPIDIAKLEELGSVLPAAKVRDFISLYLHSIEGHMTLIDQYLAADDFTGIAVQAHMMVSMSGNVGAARTSDLARRLEHAARAAGHDGVAAIGADLRGSVAKSSQALEAWLHQQYVRRTA